MEQARRQFQVVPRRGEIGGAIGQSPTPVDLPLPPPSAATRSRCTRMFDESSCTLPLMRCNDGTARSGMST